MDKSKNVFLLFINDVKEFTKFNFRVIIIERSNAQTAALQEVCPETILIFCVIHITKNFEYRFHNKTDLINNFVELIQSRITINQFTEYYESIYTTLRHEDIKYITDILSEKSTWLPRMTRNYMIFRNHFSNRVESFFGTLKNRLNRSI